MKMLLTILLLLTPAMLIGCEPASTESPEMVAFRNELDLSTTQLQAEFCAFDDFSAQRQSQCRRLVFRMLSLAETEEQKQILSDEFAAALTAGAPQFQMYDRDILTIGSDTLRNFPPADNAYLLALVEKVAYPFAIAEPTPDAGQYASLAVGHLLSTIDYPGVVGTYDDQVNRTQWNEFVLWFDANSDSFVYDADHHCYHAAESPIVRRRPPTNPTLDDPGR